MVGHWEELEFTGWAYNTSQVEPVPTWRVTYCCAYVTGGGRYEPEPPPIPRSRPVRRSWPLRVIRLLSASPDGPPAPLQVFAASPPRHPRGREPGLGLRNFRKEA